MTTQTNVIVTDRDPDTGRHVHWFTSAAFATIALVAVLHDIEGDVKDQGKKVKWVVSGISIALSLAWLGVLANVLLRIKFIGTHIEAALALLTIGFWAAVLPAIMNPEGNIATAGAFGEISNPNLYFFSWGSTIMAVLAFANFMRYKFSGSSTHDFMHGTWAALVVTSFIVMVAASRQFDDLQCQDVERDLCNRTKFAISLGTFSGFVALIWLFLGAWKFVKIVDTILACIMLGIWCFGISYITFGGPQSPAPVLGNLYFFSWGSFGLSVALAAFGVHNLLDKMMNHNAEEPIVEVEKGAEKEKDFQVVEEEEPPRDVEVADLGQNE